MVFSNFLNIFKFKALFYLLEMLINLLFFSLFYEFLIIFILIFRFKLDFIAGGCCLPESISLGSSIWLELFDLTKLSFLVAESLTGEVAKIVMSIFSGDGV